jgi:hypothetical protein
MADTTHELTEEEKKWAEQASLAESKSKLAKAELEAAQAKKSLAALNGPPGAKEEVELREGVALSKQKILQAERDRWKSPAVEALDGKISSEGTAIENRVLANEALQKAFTKLVSDINEQATFKNKPITFIILHAPDLVVLEAYNGIVEQLTVIARMYDDALSAAENNFGRGLTGGGIDPLLPAFAAGGIVRSVADILSLFRTNNEYKHFDLPVDDMQLVASIVKSAKAQKLNWTIYHPAVYPVETVPVSPGKSKLMQKLGELRKKGNKLAIVNKELEDKLARLQRDLAGCTDQTLKQELEKDIVNAQEVKDDLLSLMPIFDQLETAITSSVAIGATTQFSQLLRAERLAERLAGGDSYMIKLSAISRGSTRVRTNLFWSSGIRYSGGSELSCIVFHPDGKVLYADIVLCYIPFKKSGDIKR